MDKIYARGQKLYDHYGRERIFNGLDVCDKGAYNPETGKRVYGTQWKSGLAETFRKAGMNLVRLGLTWDAVEPKMGVYDEAFLQSIREILDECEAEGIYVYLDMHQDLYSGFGDGPGDGAPAWATLTGKYAYTKPKFVWAEGYFWGKAVHRAFDNFWNNAQLRGKGIQDRYIDMWVHVVETLGDHPAVIGFDVMNEPFPGSVGGEVFKKLVANVVKTTITDKDIRKTKLLKSAFSKDGLPKVLEQYDGDVLRKITAAADEIIRQFDTQKYAPFLNKITKAIRQTGNGKIVIMENCYYSNLGIPYACPAPSVDGETDGNVLFAPHAYDFMVDTPQYKYASNERIRAIFDEHKRSQERLQVPVIVGEWGGFTEGSEWFHHIKFLLRLFDDNKWSQTYWAYFDGFTESELFRAVLTRPHPIAVTGEIDAYCHDRAAGTFTLCYTQSGDYDAPTEVYLHKMPEAVDADGEYSLRQLGDGAAVLCVKTGVGQHSICVRF